MLNRNIFKGVGNLAMYASMDPGGKGPCGLLLAIGTPPYMRETIG
jgi:hypothetical protein